MYIDIKLIELAGFVSALQALRLPYGLDCRSKTQFEFNTRVEGKTSESSRCVELGSGAWVRVDDKDEDLLKSLIKRGDEHAKVIRGISPTLKSTHLVSFGRNLTPTASAGKRLPARAPCTFRARG